MSALDLRADEATLDALALALSDAGRRGADAFDDGARAAAQTIRVIEGEIASRRAVLDELVAALQRCEQDPEGDCSGLRHQVAVARDRLERAAQARRRAVDASDRFGSWSQRVGAARDEAVRSGEALIRRYRDGLRDYVALTASVAGGSSGGGGGGGGMSGGGGSGWAPGFPAGWELVPVSAINTADSRISGPADFGKGYSPEDLTWAYGALDRVILPGLANGQGAADFAALDAQQGLSGTRSFSMTYSGFFGGNDAVKLSAQGDGTFTVTNGYHRIWLAQRLGRSSIPARVRT